MQWLQYLAGESGHLRRCAFRNADALRQCRCPVSGTAEEMQSTDGPDDCGQDNRGQSDGQSLERDDAFREVRCGLLGLCRIRASGSL